MQIPVEYARESFKVLNKYHPHVKYSEDFEMKNNLTNKTMVLLQLWLNELDNASKKI